MAVKFRPLGPPVLLEDAAPPPASNDRDVTGYDIRLGFEWLDTTNAANPQLYRCINDDPTALRWIRLSDLEGNFRDNILIGRNTGSKIESSTAGDDNVGIGVEALKESVNTQRCIAIGKWSLRDAVYVYWNVSIGYKAFSELIFGQNNIAIGDNAGERAGTTNVSTFFGNVFIGSYAGRDIIEGEGNIAIGYLALSGDASGAISYGNIGIGQHAIKNVQTNGVANTCIGYQVAQDLTVGHSNVCIGSNNSQSLVSGQQNIIIGEHANVDVGSRSRCIVIGCQASPTKDGQLVLGSSSRPLVTHATAGATAEYLEVLINGTPRKIELKAM